jgi:hypothetical protein
MPTKVQKIRVFVASPGDVQLERDRLAKVIDEINLTIAALAPEKAVILELIRWETHVHPGMGKDPQEVINEQIGDYDIFVGIIWKRLGTPTSRARSGTEEEFQRAYNMWQEDKSFSVLFYFCQQEFAPPRTREEVEQLGKVVDFRDELSKKGLVADYASHDSFANVIRPHLLLVLGQMLSRNSPSMKSVTQRVSELNTSMTYQQILTLANEYEELRNRMDRGDQRTRQMEIIASKMRSLAISSTPLLNDLARSASPGQRLAAVSILQLIPNPEYFTWLAERIPAEKPFIGYHSSVALLTAVRMLKKTHYDELSAAIQMAKKSLEDNLGPESAKHTDRFSILNEADIELNTKKTK